MNPLFSVRFLEASPSLSGNYGQPSQVLNLLGDPRLGFLRHRGKSFLIVAEQIPPNPASTQGLNIDLDLAHCLKQGKYILRLT